MMRVKDAEMTIQQYVTKFQMAEFLNRTMLEHLQLFHFPIYSNVYVEQDEQHFLYFLVEGQVQCSHYHLNGKLAVFAISEPFTAIGDIEVLSEDRVHSNVVATRDTTMLGISNAVVERYGADDPRFLRFLIDELRKKLYKTNALQMNQILPVINRLAVYMLSHAASTPQDTIRLPDKEDLASLMGTTTRHLNRVLKELVDCDGIGPVDHYPFIRIANRSILENLAS